MMQHRFDPYLEQINSGELKMMVRLWGGRSQMRKDECIATIRQGLSDPERVRIALSNLKPFERTALGVIKALGGSVEAGALAVALQASGVPLPQSRYYHNQDTSLINTLAQRGLIRGESSYSLSHSYSPLGPVKVFSDDRLLVLVGPPEIEPFQISPVASPPSSTYRRPPAVILDIIGILQAIDHLGGLGLTQVGAVRVNDARRLIRTMGWTEKGFEVEGMPFPSPVQAFAGAFRASGLLSLGDGILVLKEPTDQFATRPYAQQVDPLLKGFIQTHEWSEIEQPSRHWEYRQNYYVQGRLALTLALAALPTDTDGFFSIDDLDQALFERIGEHFSLGYPPSRPFHYNKTPEQVRGEDAKWRAKLRTDWLADESQWIRRALSTWLYYLGLVELGIQNGTSISVRLTDLGRAVLHPELAASPDASAGEAQAGWIVQPNFDVVAYLDRTTPQQLAFLERHAQRAHAQQHTAQYRLTRESVYQGLEGGTSLEELLSGLQAGAGADLPQNVVVEIREWGALREQITLRRRACILEFPDGQARQAALKKGPEGLPVGERFLLLAAQDAAWHLTRQRVDYAQPLSACLSVNEDGVIELTEPSLDLLVQPQLDRWAERMPDGKWQLTSTSVAEAAQMGRRLSELLDLLKERLTVRLPPLLGVALRAWVGEIPEVEMATVTVLRCTQPEVFQAIASSRKIRPYLRGKLAPDVLLVDTQQVEPLKEKLAWAGLRVSDDLAIEL